MTLCPTGHENQLRWLAALKGPVRKRGGANPAEIIVALRAMQDAQNLGMSGNLYDASTQNIPLKFRRTWAFVP